MRVWGGIFIIVAGTWLALGSSAMACDAAGADFSDKFGDESFSTLWTVNGPFHRDDNGTFVLNPDPDSSATVLSNQTFGDAVICADVGITSGPDSTNTVAGVVFWAADSDNYYTLDIDINGNVYADAWQDGKFKSLASYSKSLSGNAGTEATNSLEVQTVGNKATLFVNGKRVGSVTGKPPADGQMIGILSGSSKDSAATIVPSLITVKGSATPAKVSDEPKSAPADDTTSKPSTTASDDTSTNGDGKTSSGDETTTDTESKTDTADKAAEPEYPKAAYMPKPAQEKLFAAMLEGTLTDPDDYFEFEDGVRAADLDGRPRVEFPFDDFVMAGGDVELVAFASAADAGNYLAGDENSAFAKEAARWSNGAMQFGRIRDDKGREFLWSSRVDEKNKEQWVALAMQRGDIVVFVWLDDYAEGSDLNAAALDDGAAMMDVVVDKLASLGG